MKRNAFIKLVPATKITIGELYVACLHENTDLKSASLVRICEEQDSTNADKDDDEIYDCRFTNGNTYPFLKKELFIFVAEYEVASLANPRKSVGTNIVELDRCDYKSQITNTNVVNRPIKVEVGIDFSRNVAKVLSTEKTFTLNEVIEILEELKTHDTGKLTSINEYMTNMMIDGTIEKKIQELKKKYEFGD